MTSYKPSTGFVVHKYAIVIRHIPDNIILCHFFSRNVLACEVVIVRMELDLEIFKEIIYH